MDWMETLLGSSSSADCILQLKIGLAVSQPLLLGDSLHDGDLHAVANKND